MHKNTIFKFYEKCYTKKLIGQEPIIRKLISRYCAVMCKNHKLKIGFFSWYDKWKMNLYHEKRVIEIVFELFSETKAKMENLDALSTMWFVKLCQFIYCFLFISLNFNSSVKENSFLVNLWGNKTRGVLDRDFVSIEIMNSIKMLFLCSKANKAGLKVSALIDEYKLIFLGKVMFGNGHGLREK